MIPALYSPQRLPLAIRALWARLSAGVRVIIHGPAPAIAAAPKVKRPREKRENFGTFYYFDGVLDQLDGYFKSLRLLRKHDRDTYDFYKDIGGSVIGKNVMFEVSELPATWRAGSRPSSAMIYFAFEHNRDADDDKIGLELAYFKKLRKHADLQPLKPGEVLYEVTNFYAEKRNTKLRFFGIFFVAVAADGTPRILRNLCHTELRLPNGGRVPRHKWEFPAYLQMLADEPGNKLKNRTPEELAHQIFAMLVNSAENSSLGVQVRVSKGGMTAMFNIDMLRTPYFFKDRNKTVTDRGGTKKIFHIVGAHHRRGKVIKSHFRGEREFSWHGYSVAITVPGLHHRSLHELETSLYNIDDGDPIPPDTIDSAQAGRMIAGAMEGKRA